MKPLLTGSVFCLFLSVAPLAAQDPFEIQVYEYETMAKGRYNLETHLNYVGKGTKTPEGTVSPTNNQLHMTYELTRGITQYFEVAGYLVLSRRPGVNPFLEFAGWRFRPRFRLPESWPLPFKVSISTEFGFPRKQYEEAHTTFELRPILERKVGRFQFDFNPTFGRAVRGPGTSDGWDFEPGVRVGYELTKRFEPSIEYYGGTGPVKYSLPLREQSHVFYPGFDLKLSDNVVWNVGIGFASTPSGDQLVMKMRLGWEFGKKHTQ